MLSDRSALEDKTSLETLVFATGQHVVGEYRCTGCGYGVAVRRDLPVCPMCGSRRWEPASWRPFSRARSH